MISVLIAISVSGALILNAVTLIAVGRLITAQRDRFDAFLGYAELGIMNYADLDSRVRSALSCLVAADAKLDAAKNPSETRSNAA